jgi:hypothetical protein
MSAPEFQRYSSEQLRSFLAAVDSYLAAPARMIVIGGSAVALGYGVGRPTNDVDTFETDFRLIISAVEKARQQTGLDIPVSNAPVADLPYHFTDRLQPVLPELERLSVFVPEAHDLVLSKMVRATQHDFEAIEELHAVAQLNFDLLLERYLDEMDHAVTDLDTLDLKFFICVRSLFGELRAQRAKTALLAKRVKADPA